MIESAIRNTNGEFSVVKSGGRILHVPDDMLNVDRAELAAWEAAGNKIQQQRPSLDASKSIACEAVNSAAEAQRLRYITSGIGQSMTYSQKLDEARMILVDDAATTAADAMTPDELKATYPMIWASIPADGKTASVVAASVHGKALAWAQIGAQIEKKRRDALDAIAAAATPEQVAAAATVEW